MPDVREEKVWLHLFITESMAIMLTDLGSASRMIVSFRCPVP
ncbi:MAG: hypothetical protein ACTSVD_02475 [Candidatus Thorarchaeota archaeon]